MLCLWWAQWPARFLASLSRPGMYDATETRLTEHQAKGGSGYSLASVTRECTGQPGDTMYKTWSPWSARLLADLGRPEMCGATGRPNEVRALMLIRCRGMKPACARRKLAAGHVWHEFPTCSNGALLPYSSALSYMPYRCGLTRLPVPDRAALSFVYVQWLGNASGPPARRAVHHLRLCPGICWPSAAG